jgi:hypothetical protein
VSEVEFIAVDCNNSYFYDEDSMVGLYGKLSGITLFLSPSE